MIFTSLIFLFLFLPLTLFFYYIAAPRFRNGLLLLASLIFYAWGGFSITSVLLGSILLNYWTGILISRSKTDQRKKTWFVIGLVVNLLLLVVFKYTNFLVDNTNVLMDLFGVDPFIVDTILLPLGLSFYTFKAISYLISVKREEMPAERNIIRLGLFIALFPALVAGPIDRFTTLGPQIKHPAPSLDLFVSGIRRFSLGMLKKLIIANPLAEFSTIIFDLSPETLNPSVSWIGAIILMLEIYIDFSAYTDMAIGVGRMFGLRLMENFDYPYKSRSVHEFWRRWHISLSFWLRDYLFLPMAYAFSRKMKKERYGGIRVDYLIYLPAAVITFVLCGLWHGAAWTFLVWGLIHGLFLVLERIGLERWLKKRWKGLSHLYLLVFLLFSWILFRSGTVESAWTYFGAMFGANTQNSGVNMFAILFSDYELLVAVVLGILASAGGFTWIPVLWKKILEHPTLIASKAGFHLMQTGTIVFVLGTLFVALLYLIGKTNTPFLYMQF
jgi:alginate O-acetyltransferase complex protein AlgI